MANETESLTYLVNAVDNASSTFDKIGGSIGNLALLAAGAAAAGIAALTAAIAGSITAAVSWGDKLDGISDVLGTTAKESSALSFAVESVGGNVEGFTGQLAYMEKGLFNNKGEAGRTGKVIQELGINLKSFSTMSASQQAQTLSDKFAAMPDGLQKSELMMGVFGRSGKNLSDTLNGLANGGMAAASKSVEDYGLSITDSGVQTTIDFIKTIKQFDLMGRGVLVAFGNEFIPVLVQLGRELLTLARSALPTVHEALHQFAQTIITIGVPAFERFIDSAVSVVKFFVANWPTISSVISNGFKIAGKVVSDVVAILRNLIDAGRIVAAAFSKELSPSLNSLGVEFLTLARLVLPTTSTKFTELAGVITSIGIPALKFLIDVAIDVIGFFINNWHYISDTVGTIFKVVARFIAEHIPSWEYFKNKVWGYILWVIYYAEQMRDTVKTTLAKIETFIKTSDAWLFLKSQWEVLTTWFTKNWPLIKETFSTVWEFIKPILGILWIKTLQDVGVAWVILKFVISDALDSITSAVRTAMLILTGHWSDAMNEIYDRTYRMVSNVKGLLGIHSPSKVFSDIGKNMMLGLQEGVQDFSHAPITALHRVTGGMIMGASASTANNYNLTINSNATSENVAHSYQMMKALA